MRKYLFIIMMCVFLLNPAKRNVLVVKNETRILEQKRKVIQKFQ